MFECRHLPLSLPATLAGELATAYAEPQRAYHNAAHIAELLRWFDIVADGPGWLQPAEAYATILFHDAIYVPGAKDNEVQSAAWARRSGLPVDTERVAEWILLTAQHGSLDAASGDAALFLDSDMAILGTSLEAYREYAQQIRREYAMVPPEAYRAGRRAFVAAVAQRPRIYFTAFFHDQLDTQARTNLADELASLG